MDDITQTLLDGGPAPDPLIYNIRLTFRLPSSFESEEHYYRPDIRPTLQRPIQLYLFR